MRQLTTTIFVAVIASTAGCNNWMHRRDGNAENAVANNEPAPKVEQLVSYLNDCSSRLKSVQSNGLFLDCKQGIQSVGLTANMICEKPRNFRLSGTLAGSPACDVGSNNEEFWYWIKQDNPPYLYHCSYEAMSHGNVQLPFPFQPEMVTAALGMAEYDPNPSKYDLKVLPQRLELSENGLSAQGQPIRKVTVIARGKQDVSQGKPQITDFILKDAQGHDLCKASVERVQVVRVDSNSSAIVPQKIRLSWPAQKMELAMTFNSVIVNSVNPQMAQTAFNRGNLPYQSFDLARRAPDASSTSIQRVRGYPQ